MREMKDSGVAWLGDIDSRFDIKAIGNLFTIKKDIIGREPDQVLSITQRGIKIKDTTSNEGQNAASYAHYQIVNVGDFAMNHMDLLTGWVDISQYEGVTSPDYRVFTLTDNTQIPEYFLRVFQMYYSNRVFYAFGQGAANLGRWRLPRENFVKIAIPCPPVELQRKIVDEIAAKVSKVDALIANQQAQIEKLKQYKQSLITEVVTKGLDSDAPMKDSGVEWIGNICASFVPYRIKDLLLKEKDAIRVGPFGSALKGSDILDEGEYWVYNQRVVLDSSFVNSNTFINKAKYEELSSFRVQAGDVLCTTRGSIGKIARVPELYCEGVIHPCIIRFRINDELVNYKLLELIFNFSDVVIGQLKLSSNATTIDVVYSDSLRNVTIPLGSMKQQDELVRFLAPKCAKIDNLIGIKLKKIEKLSDYKKSLIYEYVTGKKEVI